MSRDYAAARVRQTPWNPNDPARQNPATIEQQAIEHAQLTRQAFGTAAGRKMLDRMIASYLLQKPHNAPESGTDAAYREGQASVVKQILQDMKLTAGDLNDGSNNS